MNITKQQKAIIIIWSAFLIPTITLTILFSLITNGKLGFMPSFEQLENPKSNLATQIISSDTVILGTYFKENRLKADYSELSPYLIKALIATEDSRYFDHSGIDFRSLGRVVVKSIISGDESSGGGSTITQQLAKLLFPRERFSSVFEIINRKFREWVIAVNLEKAYTKEEIIAMYLNEYDYLNLAVGIKTATKVYFNTTPQDLKIEEAAMLIGMLKNSSLFNPIRFPDTTLHRRNVVLSQMVKYKKITQEEYDSLKTLPLGVNFQKVDHKLGIAPYLREYLRISLGANPPVKEKFYNYESYQEDSARWADDPLYGWCYKNKKPDGSEYNIYRDGLKIYTTVNATMQKYAEDAVAKHMKEVLQPTFFKEQKYNKYAPYTFKDITRSQYKSTLSRNMRQTERYRVLRQKKIHKDTIKAIFNRPVPMKIFSWKGVVDTVMSPMDSIIYMKHFLHAGLLSMEPQSGYVRAFVGGIDYNFFQYDHVIMQRRQVGSTFKPFLYTLAMQEGLSPCHKLANVPTTFYMADTSWTPKNADDNKLGEMVTLEWGLAQSNNYISAKLMQMFRPEPVINIAREMGVKSDIPAVPSICLGVADLTLYEMVGAYSTFANSGVYTEPIFVTKIEDKYGNILATFTPKRNDAISEETAYLMINLLENVVNRGTSVRLRFTYQMHNQIAGKTGTTNDHTDGWFMGLVPNLVTGVWVGGDEQGIHFKSIRDGQGANMALPIWANYMQSVYQDSARLGYLPSEEFEKPESVPYWKIDCREYETRQIQLDEKSTLKETEQELDF